MNENLPALTVAEADLLEHYVRMLELLARVNPARTSSTIHGCLIGAQALISEAKALHAALASMHSRGEDEMFNHVLSQVLGHLQAQRHLAQLNLAD